MRSRNGRIQAVSHVRATLFRIDPSRTHGLYSRCWYRILADTSITAKLGQNGYQPCIQGICRECVFSDVPTIVSVAKIIVFDHIRIMRLSLPIKRPSKIQIQTTFRTDIVDRKCPSSLITEQIPNIDR